MFHTHVDCFRPIKSACANTEFPREAGISVWRSSSREENTTPAAHFSKIWPILSTADSVAEDGRHASIMKSQVTGRSDT